MFIVAVRCHCLTFLLAGRQVIPSPFARYSSAGNRFWLIRLCFGYDAGGWFCTALTKKTVRPM